MGIELLLVGSGELLAGLGGRDGVLGDGEPAPNSVLAQRDVVILRAREVLEQVAVRLRRHDAQVEPEALVGDHGRLRVALRDDVGDVLACREVVDQRRWVGRRRDHVEVAERLASTARRARLRHLHGRRVRAELLDELEQHRQDRCRAAASTHEGPWAAPRRAPSGSSPRSLRRAPPASAAAPARPLPSARRAW